VTAGLGAALVGIEDVGAYYAGLTVEAALAEIDAAAGAEYLRSGLDKGMVSFSLQAVVEISRLNAFRMSTIWQMVTSHLRMLASLKVSIAYHSHESDWKPSAANNLSLRCPCLLSVECEHSVRECVRHLRHHPDHSAAHALSAEPAAHGARGLRRRERQRQRQRH
jgi:hypothetical protein